MKSVCEGGDDSDYYTHTHRAHIVYTITMELKAYSGSYSLRLNIRVEVVLSTPVPDTRLCLGHATK